jgi:choline dehydrogenase-like flavoprotein
VTRVGAETVVIGSGVSGMLVARELVRAGRQVTVLERGSLVPWEEQIRRQRWEGDGPTSAHNHECDPAGQYRPWQYVYGVGGTSNSWSGNSPRLLPEDFETHSRHGVARDWPISYDELNPYYARAEEALGIAGDSNGVMPGATYPLPAHPASPLDQLLEPLLDPFIPMPQARASAPVRGREACNGSASCTLCPVDARFSVLNGLPDVLADPRVELLDETIAERLVARDGRVAAVECVRANGERVTLEAERFVVAANAIESAGLLLRSGMDHGDTGRNLLDHTHAYVIVHTTSNVGPGRGATWSTGASYTYYGGDFRSERAGILIYPWNGGAPVPNDTLIRALVEGRRGPAVREAMMRDWEGMFKLVASPDELPSPDSRVTLSSRKDAFGMPLNLVHAIEPSDYQQRAIRHLADDLPRRLAPLGVRKVDMTWPAGVGAHLLGTLRMGADADAVVDADGRHARFENLFVSGGAVFPSMSPAHPTLTIAALAIRLGEQLAAPA